MLSHRSVPPTPLSAGSKGPRDGCNRGPVLEQLEPRRLLSGLDPLGVEALVAASAPFDPTLAGAAADWAAALEPVAAAAPFPLDQTFLLHSRPTATKTIYLDFDGHTTSGTNWNTQFNSGAPIDTPAYSFEGDSSTFSSNELTRIQYIWQRVAEDFLPFDVNVTTQDPGAADLAKSGVGDTKWGIRVVIGGSSYDWYGGGAGGVAYVGSFTWSTDTPCFIFPDNLGSGNEKYTAEAISHEVGHTLGLGHDGTSSVEYYSGHGSGATGWAPIMGVGYYQQLVQWSKGEYAGANNTQDDLAIITANNGFGYRPDDHGNAFATASALTITGGTAVFGEGIIERNTDVDYFTFTTGGGGVSLSVAPAPRGPNLDIQATLYDASGAVLSVSNLIGSLNAQIVVSLPAGTYYLSIDGVGQGDLVSGYSDYGSLGSYSVTGTIVDPNALPWVTIAATDATAAEKGQETGSFTITRVGGAAAALEVFYAVGGTAVNGSDYAAIPVSATIPVGAVSVSVVIRPVDDDLREGEETVVLTLQAKPTYYVGSPAAATVAIADNDLIVGVDDFAASEVTNSGTLTAGSLASTFASDNVYEQITERESSGPQGRRYSFLEHTWTFQVTGGRVVTFFVEAYHTANGENDDFVFEYSADGSHWTYLLTVTKTADDHTAQQAVLPGNLAGKVYVRVKDTDRTAGRRAKDSLFVDRMFIRCDPSLPGDANLDGAVDYLDYIAYKENVGAAGSATWLECDFDHDGDVDREDLMLLKGNYGRLLEEVLAAPPAEASGAVAADAPAPPAWPAWPTSPVSPAWPAPPAGNPQAHAAHPALPRISLRSCLPGKGAGRLGPLQFITRASAGRA